MRYLYRSYFLMQSLFRRLYAPVTMGCRALVLKGDSVLLVRMTYIEGWYLPGGGVDRGESFADACVRELGEECGIRAEKLKLIGLFLNTNDRRIDHIALYLVEAFTGEPRVVDTHEIAQVGFFPVNALPPGVAPGHRRRIEEQKAQKPVSSNW